MRYQIILTILCIFLSSIKQIQALDPYSILRVPKDATDREVELKYKKMRSKNRNNRMRKTMIKGAYSNIMNARKNQKQP